MSSPAKRVAVVVLGDVGRSPRMQYHALALAQAGVQVDLIGAAGSTLAAGITDNAAIRCHLFEQKLRAARHAWSRPLFVAYSGLRAVREALTLGITLLLRIDRPDVILVQNPPAIPVLLIAWMAARLRGAKLTIDWHNYGFALLGLTLGPRNPLVALARAYEMSFGRRADAALCVSQAMAIDLKQRWGIEAAILYDRPAAQFEVTPAAERQALLHRLEGSLEGYNLDSSMRPVLIVSSTSWTKDEDFSLLIDAARLYDQAARQYAGTLPRLLFVITGRGPLRAHYEELLRGLDLHLVHFETLWLEPADYPRLLGMADLGVCLHRSASGVDLPMKVADMVGAGLPVLALRYGDCIQEMIVHGRTGMLFTSSRELFEQLAEIVRGFPTSATELSRLRRTVGAARGYAWDAGWRDEAWPVLQRQLGNTTHDQER
jgi:beta-1,4-mannosyltransferase